MSPIWFWIVIRLTRSGNSCKTGTGSTYSGLMALEVRGWVHRRWYRLLLVLIRTSRSPMSVVWSLDLTCCTRRMNFKEFWPGCRRV
ncbi:hypothetical protein EDC04DRAFT_2640984 [Pisolithus marmoratus]|nr:hypothetical protein EDC04DRAFT_2640984 [Pisolithus marmoratus]